MGTAFFIILVHYVADFVFQSGEWGAMKSKCNRALIMHTLMYALIWVVPAAFLFNFGCKGSIFGTCVYTGKLFIFLVVTFIVHTVQDYITSRITSKGFENKNYMSGIPNFGAFSVIGLDQVLHYAQLFLTYYLLK